MTSGRDIYNACVSFEGQPYSTAPGRTDPNSGHKDCSGMVAAGYEKATGYELGAYTSSAQFAQARNQGLVIPREYAFAIVGAVIYKPEDPMQGIGPAGHVAISDGKGGTIEATPPTVRRLPLSYNAPWSSQASLLPGIDYENHGEGASASPLPKDEDMFIVLDRDANTRRLYTSLGNQIVDEGFANELAFSGVPVYNVPHGVADSIAVIHVAHTNQLLEAVPCGEGDPDKPLSAWTDVEIVNEFNWRAGQQRVGFSGTTAVDLPA